jgi:hypothetical protein
VTTSPAAGPRGFECAKKVDGVKRHLLVDSAAILVAATVAEAAIRAGVSVDILSGPKPVNGFQLSTPPMGVVECTNGWIKHGRGR